MSMVRTNDPTRYEVVATNGDRTILVAYTPRKTRPGLASALVNTFTRKDNSSPIMRIEALAWLTNTDPQAWVYSKKAAEGFRCGQWVVRFSGRTQRDAYTSGELAESIYD